MKDFLKNKIVTVLIIVATLILAGIAIFTAIRLYQLRQVAVAPNVPESIPQAAETATPAPTGPQSCAVLDFSLATSSPTSSPTVTPTGSPTLAPTATPTHTPFIGGPTSTPVTTKAPTAIPTATPSLPSAGTGWPTVVGAGAGVLLIIGSLLLIL